MDVPNPVNPKGRVLFIGASFYNNYYLSRALRGRGWQADTLVTSQEGAGPFLHGGDYYFDFDHEWDYRYNNRILNVLSRILQSWGASYSGNVRLFKGLSKRVVLKLFKGTAKLAGWPQRKQLGTLRHAIDVYDIFHFTGTNSTRYMNFMNLQYFGSMPLGWDIRILKRLGKKIVYTNIGCNDGVSQTSFSKWPPTSVCSICRWQEEPSVCSDARNLEWGKLRNELCDYQCLLGGNRTDCNVDPKVHEVPEFYCLDKNFWNPDLLVPANYLLPLRKKTIKIYHSVGNYDLRTHGKDAVNIKCTHIIRPLVERLKREGLDVELVFLNDVPSKQVRYYQLQSDIVIDMLTFGWFGANIREAMMLGKPAICYIRPEWLEQVRMELPEYARDLPVVSATPETAYDVLKDLVVNGEKRKEIGRNSRQFALRWHSAEAAGKKFDEIYSQLLVKSES